MSGDESGGGAGPAETVDGMRKELVVVCLGRKSGLGVDNLGAPNCISCPPIMQLRLKQLDAIKLRDDIEVRWFESLLRHHL